jgi:benzoyl-CoA reductase/2-hydroxyglutaryl-CoA dehydratase subunit BcrC/BadD/HgdB
MAVRSRELTYKERMSVLSVKKHLQLKSYLLEQIDPQSLPLKDYISYKVLKESCTPMSSALGKIEAADEDLEDQSKKLRVLYEGCMEGTLGLGHLYQKYKG